MAARTGLPGQDCKESQGRTKRRGQQKRTAGTGQLEQDSQNDSTRIGQPEQNNQDRASRQDRQSRIAGTALSGQYC